MRHVTVEVLANVEIMPGVFLLRLDAPEIVEHARSGQFLHVHSGWALDPLLRRPLSLHRIGRERSARVAGTSEIGGGQPSLVFGRPNPGEIEILFARVGRGTTLLAQSMPGDALSVIGPLGNGFSIEPKTRNLLLVAGGLGIAPLVALADEAIRREMTVTLLAGARSKDGILPACLLPPEVEYVVCTDDGSQGRHGVVTQLVPELLDWADQVFACGPRAMIEALACLRLPTSKTVQVSLEERMACGVGACLGCVTPTRKGLQRVCRDGPVFNLKELQLL